MKIWSEDKDMKTYHEMEEELIRKHHGEVAVFCEGKLIAIGKTIKEAVEVAKKQTGSRNFFVRELYTVKEQAECMIRFLKDMEVVAAVPSEEDYPEKAPRLILGRNFMEKFRIVLDGISQRIYVDETVTTGGKGASNAAVTYGAHEVKWITISTDEYESMRRTIEILSDRDLMEQIEDGEKDGSKAIDFEELASELGI